MCNCDFSLTNKLSAMKRASTLSPDDKGSCRVPPSSFDPPLPSRFTIALWVQAKGGLGRKSVCVFPPGGGGESERLPGRRAGSSKQDWSCPESRGDPCMCLDQKQRQIYLSKLPPTACIVHKENVECPHEAWLKVVQRHQILNLALSPRSSKPLQKSL